jgi:signal transduction histidine kinase
MAHESLMTQVVSNLVGNAIKFCSPEVSPRITIWTEARGETVRIWVEDNGIGIKPEHQERIWGMFERIHPQNRYEGTGIGLAIVRKAVEKMDGSVGLESDGVRGSKFWVELPAGV